MRHALLAILTVFVLALGTPVKAQSFEDGIKAYEAGDYSTAFEIWLPLAEKGNADAQYETGDMYYYGKGVLKKNYAEALFWYRMAAEQGHTRAQTRTGYMYESGQGVSRNLRNFKKALRWYRKAADAIAHNRGEMPSRVYYEARIKGLLSKIWRVGVLYEKGDGVPLDYAEAMRLYKFCAELGTVEKLKDAAMCMKSLGHLYSDDKFIEADPVEAIYWWTMAAKLGDASHVKWLGTVYLFGLGGVQRNYAEAMRLFKMLAEQGDAKSQSDVGWMYHKGRGVQKDYAEAIRWYRMAAEQGDTDAQLYLGEMYGMGQGVQLDIVTAYMWFNLSYENGHRGAKRRAKKRIIKFSNRITPAQIQEAKVRARMCLNSNYQDCD